MFSLASEGESAGRAAAPSSVSAHEIVSPGGFGSISQIDRISGKKKVNGNGEIMKAGIIQKEI